jgi:thioredoxin-related protein
MKMGEKGYFVRRLLTLLIFLFPPMVSAASVDSLPLATDFQRDAQLSKQQHIPILVFYMADDCPYCEAVSELYLEPMYRNGLDKGRFILRTVKLDGSDYLRGFYGRKMRQEDFANQQGVSFTPVIRLYDYRGFQLVPEIFGYQTPELYGGYLDAAIDKSIAKLR